MNDSSFIDVRFMFSTTIVPYLASSITDIQTDVRPATGYERIDSCCCYAVEARLEPVKGMFINGIEPRRTAIVPFLMYSYSY